MSGLITIATGIDFPEGPAFAPDGSLWAVELEGGGGLVRITAAGMERFAVGGSPNGIAIDRAGRILFCDRVFDNVRVWDAGETTVAVPGDGAHRLDKPNDLAFDRVGNLVFTCPGEAIVGQRGEVWCQRPDGALVHVSAAMDYPNGLVFNATGDTLYVADTLACKVWRGHWDEQAATWTHVELFCETGGPIGPDGMAFDAHGRLYVAVYGLGVVQIFNAEGQWEEDIPTGGEKPTNCAFDPSGRLGLVITEAEHGVVLSDPTRGPGIALFAR